MFRIKKKEKKTSLWKIFRGISSVLQNLDLSLKPELRGIQDNCQGFFSLSLLMLPKLAEQTRIARRDLGSFLSQVAEALRLLYLGDGEVHLDGVSFIGLQSGALLVDGATATLTSSVFTNNQAARGAAARALARAQRYATPAKQTMKPSKK